jgi:nucleoside-diphosphate-sugar epimerase
VARVLIVGCGCRGRELASGLVAAGHAVRGTTRDPARVAEIEATGAEGVVADPFRLATLLPQIEGVGVICWLLGSAEGDAAPLHRERLQSLLERLVDAPVRGFVYEASGTADPAALADGAAALRRFRETFHVPVELVDGDYTRWPAAVGRVLGERSAGAGPGG